MTNHHTDRPPYRYPDLPWERWTEHCLRVSRRFHEVADIKEAESRHKRKMPANPPLSPSHAVYDPDDDHARTMLRIKGLPYDDFSYINSLPSPA